MAGRQTVSGERPLTSGLRESEHRPEDPQNGSRRVPGEHHTVAPLHSSTRSSNRDDLPRRAPESDVRRATGNSGYSTAALPTGMTESEWTCVPSQSSSSVNQASVATITGVRRTPVRDAPPCARQADKTTEHTAGYARTPEHHG